MMDRLLSFTLVLSCTLITAISPASTEAAETIITPPGYTAVYQVLRNDKRLAGVTIQLSHQGDTSTLHGFTHDMRGLADLLNVKGVQTVTGSWLKGNFRPQRYDFSFSLVGYKSVWQAEFDWLSGFVMTSSKSGNTHLPLTSSTADPFSLSLNIGSYLDQDQAHMEINIIEEDEIENHVYQADMNESLDTALGCLQTTRVKRIRKNTKRTSLAWYANDFNYVPVLMQHFKKNGKGLSMQIISLEMSGQPVERVASCLPGDTQTHEGTSG